MGVLPMHFLLMMIFNNYLIADVVVRIGYNLIQTEKSFELFRCANDVQPAFSIECDLESLKKYANDNGICDEQLIEYGYICLKFTEKMFADYDAMLFHSSALNYLGNGILFSAVSGTGKSTHANLWRRKYGDDVVMINDDKPMIRFIDGKIIVYGTPWMGKHGIGSNTKAELKAICFINRSETNFVERISPINSVAKILRQTMIFSEIELQEKLLGFVDRIVNEVSLFDLHVNVSLEAAEVCHDAVMEGL